MFAPHRLVVSRHRHPPPHRTEQTPPVGGIPCPGSGSSTKTSLPFIHCKTRTGYFQLISLETVYLTYHEHPVAPPVGCRAVALAVDDLWSHVLDGTTEREGFLLFEDGLLTQPEVGQLHVAVSVQ